MASADSRAAEYLAEVVTKYPIKVDRDKFRIFLFGPFLEQNEEVPEPEVGATPFIQAKFLRYYVAKSLRDSGWIVDFGENKEILEMWTSVHGPVDVGKMEFDHASVACGAIVILPSSPGSFCEMGLFSSSDQISKKTLAVVHAKHKNDESFFRKGLVQVFRSQGGTCEYEHYGDKEAVLNAISEFVQARLYSGYWRDQAIATGERRKHEKGAE